MELLSCSLRPSWHFTEAPTNATGNVISSIEGFGVPHSGRHKLDLLMKADPKQRSKAVGGGGTSPKTDFPKAQQLFRGVLFQDRLHVDEI